MAFLYPAFLFALASIAIPIIIHLFNFRRYKTVYFPNVKFLKEVKEKTDSRSQLKHLLVLLCRILAISFLVFAFAQPYIKSNTTKIISGKKVLSIYIDNSFSMGQMVADVPLLDQAKAKAKEIVGLYSDNDDYQLLTNDFEGRHQRLVDKAEMLNLINEVKPSPATKNISEVIAKQKQAMGTPIAIGAASEKLLYVLSDFQESSSDFSNLPVDSSLEINLVALSSREAANVYVDTCWLETPVQLFNQTAKLLVTIVNNSDEAIESGRLTLKINDEIKAINDFSIDPNALTTDTIQFNITTKSWNRAELSIIDHPITFDDNYYFTFEVADQVPVMIINEQSENPFLNAVFASNPFFITQNIPFNQLNYADLHKKQCVVINGVKQLSSGLSAELKKFMEEGGNLLFFPDATGDQSSYNQFLQSVNADQFTSYVLQARNVNSINVRDAVFSLVFLQLPQNMALPKTTAGFITTRLTSTNALPILQFSDGTYYFTKYSFGNGTLYLSAVPLDEKVTDLPSSPVFAPMLYNMAVMRSSQKNSSYVIGKENEAMVDAGESGSEEALHLKGTSEEIIPAQRSIGSRRIITIGDEMHESGFYALQDSRSNISAWYALNFDRRESDMKFLTNEELKELAPMQNIRVIENTQRNLADVISGQRFGLPLWKVSVIFVLIFIALEILLLKFWK